MKSIAEFREDTRDWLEANCPQEMRNLSFRESGQPLDSKYFTNVIALLGRSTKTAQLRSVVGYNHEINARKPTGDGHEVV